MTLQTFLSVRAGWRLYEGIGDRGRLVRQVAGAPWVRHVASAGGGSVWVSDDATVARVGLPGLDSERVPPPGRRIGAVAAEPFGARVLVTGLPADPHGRVRLLVWESRRWRELDPSPAVDVSSALTWLDTSRVVYESVGRRLVVFDIDTASAEEVFSGRLPCASPLARTWYAVSGERVVEVPYERPFEPRPVAGFRFGTVAAMSWSPDGAACLWKQPRFWYRNKGFAQDRGGPRTRVRSLDEGVGVVVLG